MILECPACQARYTVPDNAIGPNGRTVRCAKCGNSWREEPRAVDEPVAEPVAVADQDTTAAVEAVPVAEDSFNHHDAVDEEPPLARDRKRWPIILGLAALFAVLLVGAVLALGPDQLRQRFGSVAGGPSVSLLLEVPRKPERRTLASGNELFALTGRIVNPTRERQAVPDIQAELQDAQGRVVYNWIITPPQRTLGPGGTAQFDAAVYDVPKGARELKLSFVGSKT